MIDISGHLRDIRRDVGFSSSDSPIVINCCGYQFFNKSNFSRFRPSGRFDYQIIYLVSGKAKFLIQDVTYDVVAGDVVIYKPYEIQKYEYDGDAQSQVYWIHFTGSQALEILTKTCGTHQLFNIGIHQDIAFYFNSIRDELLLKNNDYENIINLEFTLLLKLISRYRIDLKSKNEHQHIFNHLILTLNDTYNDEWNIEKMASLCSMSQSRFLHLFKEQKGLSPMQFLMKLRIDKAKEIMIHSSISIQDVSKLVGYNDPLYFSRIFKKTTGQSPRQYIKSSHIDI